MSLGPAPVLALLIGILHVSIYVLIRGSAGQRLPWLVLAAFLGAWAGDALGARLGIGVLVVGDFHMVAASVLAWVGIMAVAIVAVLAPRPELESRSNPSTGTTGLLVRRRARRLPLELEPRESASEGDDPDPDHPPRVAA